MFENLKKYREKMDKYRDNLLILIADKKVYFKIIFFIFH